MLLHDLESGALAVARGGAGQQGADRVNRLACAADDPAHVALAKLDAENRHLAGRNLREHHFIGKLDELANDELEELFHDLKAIGVGRTLPAPLKPRAWCPSGSA